MNNITKHQCEAMNKTGSQCSRMISIQMSDGRWLCRQHGGPTNSPTCSICNKNIPKWDSKSLKQGKCLWCCVVSDSQQLLECFQNRRTYDNDNIDEDPK